MTEKRRYYRDMSLEKEWLKILDENNFIYIYGAGQIGKKILKLIQNEGQEYKIKGFLVTDLGGNPDEIGNIPVMLMENADDKTYLILISVGDMHQDFIESRLKKNGFTNIVVAHKYSFMIGDDFEKASIQMKNTEELLLHQYRKNAFNRYDTIVRLLAVENYYGKNNCGFALYKKMQQIRSGNDEYGEIAVQRFRRLIQSFEEDGYKEESELVVDKELHLVNGSHRLALAIYFKIPQLRVRVLPQVKDIIFGKEWFEKFFEEMDIQLIESRLSEERIKVYERRIV